MFAASGVAIRRKFSLHFKEAFAICIVPLVVKSSPRILLLRPLSSLLEELGPGMKLLPIPLMKSIYTSF